MRLFIGIPASELLKNQVDRVLKEKPFKASWVRSENLHITLKFLGEVEEKNAKSIIDNFEKVLKPLNKKVLPFEGASSFPNEKKPRVLFLKFFEDPELLKYQRDVEISFEREGFKKEEREFKVHLTLARFKFPPEIEKFRKLLEKLSKESFEPFE
ncbi:MAG: RNA 2',3'-cyclic phosphodiesterase, partial [Thermoanaerobaculia bacterium]